MEKITQNQHFWGAQVQADGRDLDRALDGVKTVQKNTVSFAELCPLKPKKLHNTS